MVTHPIAATETDAGYVRWCEVSAVLPQPSGFEATRIRDSPVLPHSKHGGGDSGGGSTDAAGGGGGGK